MERKEIELLAPAGTKEALIAAVMNGANAVYVGGAMFSARQSAGNFDKEELRQAVEFVHRHKAKIYVAVNTLVKDQELPELIEWLSYLEAIKVDAIIVQDLGVMKLIKENFDLEIHASTQMSIHNREGVELLKAYGVKRVVLARENSLKDVSAIRETGVELEVFVHGALCICYSGQCLMSSMIGGRSGNRGRCAQPCRMKYQLVNKEGEVLSDHAGEYLLSPRDLNTIEMLPEIIEAGVTSLKIEGRMKRPEYVATVVHHYRKALDAYYGKDTLDKNCRQELAQIFNRDFTDGYFHVNRRKDLMSWKKPNNRGIFLGRVKTSDKAGFTVAPDLPLQLGDGLEIWVTKGGRKGIILEYMEKNGKKVTEVSPGEEVFIPFKDKTFKGDRIFKTSDISLLNRAQSSYENISLERTVPLDIAFFGEEQKPLVMRVRDDEGHEVMVETDVLAEKAINRPLTSETLEKQMRFGGTVYILNQLDNQIKGDLIVPVSKINDLRRKAIEQLDVLREDHLVIKRANVSLPNYHGKTKGLHLSVEVDTEKAALNALGAGADKVYLHLEHYRGHKRDPQLLKGASGNLHMVLPRIWHEKDREALEGLYSLYDQYAKGYLTGNLGGIQFLKQRTEKPVWGDWSLNIYNSLSLEFLKALGLDGVNLSLELTLDELGNISDILPKEVMVHGRVPLMISEHCIVGSVLGAQEACQGPCLQDEYALKDRLNFLFPLRTDSSCRMQVLNSKELCFMEGLPQLKEKGVTSVRLSLRDYHAQDVVGITNIYRKAIDKVNKGIDINMELEELEKLKVRGFTKGHYYRGVE